MTLPRKSGFGGMIQSAAEDYRKSKGEARRQRAEEAWRNIKRSLDSRAVDENWQKDIITEIEQAMDDMADYLTGSVLT